MKSGKYLLLLQLLFHIVNNIAAQWCTKLEEDYRTRLVWRQEQRLIMKTTFFGRVDKKYVPYRISTVERYKFGLKRVLYCCPGYKQVNASTCEPICSPPCPSSAHCLPSNVCECNPGYEGITTHPSLVVCRPVCMTRCSENSHCSEPNICTCNDGYSATYNGTCEPICQEKCPDNSKCLQPNNCVCNKGYEYNSTSGTCQPKCSNRCSKNAVCSAPYTCTCVDGYEMVDNQCQAKCDAKCPENSICSKPNICECLKGYENSTNSECMPKCQEECPVNSICSKPNICECLTGFEKSSNKTCQPINTGTEVSTAEPDIISPQFEVFISNTALTPLQESTSFMALKSQTQLCSDTCQCWQEYDEIGSLTTDTQCINPCTAGNTHQCLNVSLCHCDTAKMQLSCQTADDPEEEPFVYMCKIERTLLAPIVTKSASNLKLPIHIWIILITVIGMCCLMVLGVLVYRRVCRHRNNARQDNESSPPLTGHNDEYEL